MIPAHAAGLFNRLTSTLKPVTFGAAGTGASVGTGVGSIDVAYPSGIAAGSLLILHVVVRSSTSSFIFVPNGWFAISQVGSATDQSLLMVKLATGSESGTLAVAFANPSTSSALGRMYRFVDGKGIDAIATGVHDNTNDTTATAVDLTTGKGNALALQVISGGANTTIGEITGESGVDYTEAVAEFAASTPAGFLSLQTGLKSSPGAITGGSATMGASTTDIIHAISLHSDTEGDVTPAAIDWGNITSITTSGTNSAQTVSGISGRILLKFDINVTGGSGNMFCNRNASGDVAFNDNGGLVVKDGDTVSFRATRTGANFSGDITVKNASDGDATLDTFTFSVDPI